MNFSYLNQRFDKRKEEKCLLKIITAELTNKCNLLMQFNGQSTAIKIVFAIPTIFYYLSGGHVSS